MSIREALDISCALAVRSYGWAPVERWLGDEEPERKPDPTPDTWGLGEDAQMMQDAALGLGAGDG